MFEELMKQWVDEQGFQTWSQDHAAVLRNLALWLNQNATKQAERSSAPHGQSCACNNCLHKADATFKPASR